MTHLMSSEYFDIQVGASLQYKYAGTHNGRPVTFCNYKNVTFAAKMIWDLWHSIAYRIWKHVSE